MRDTFSVVVGTASAAVSRTVTVQDKTQFVIWLTDSKSTETVHIGRDKRSSCLQSDSTLVYPALGKWKCGKEPITCATADVESIRMCARFFKKTQLVCIHVTEYPISTSIF